MLAYKLRFHTIYVRTVNRRVFATERKSDSGAQKSGLNLNVQPASSEFGFRWITGPVCQQRNSLSRGRLVV
jgi:hypothetical protein